MTSYRSASVRDAFGFFRRAIFSARTWDQINTEFEKTPGIDATINTGLASASLTSLGDAGQFVIFAACPIFTGPVFLARPVVTIEFALTVFGALGHDAAIVLLVTNLKIRAVVIEIAKRISRRTQSLYTHFIVFALVVRLARSVVVFAACKGALLTDCAFGLVCATKTFALIASRSESLTIRV